MEIRPTRNLDVAGAAALDAQLVSAESDVTLDLSAVDRCASSGLRVILKASQRLSKAGATRSSVNANDTVREVCKISGFGTVVTIEPDGD